MTRSTRLPLVLAVFTLVGAALSASPVLAQDRATNDRARMELAFSPGYALGVTTVGGPASDTPWGTGGLAAAVDLRLYAPCGLGAVLRAGYEGIFTSGLFTVDVGAAYRGDLVHWTHTGFQLVASAGASGSYGTLTGIEQYFEGWIPQVVSSQVVALGGVWGSVHVDFWYRNFFVGLGATARAQWADGYDGTLVSLSPALRVGADWSL